MQITAWGKVVVAGRHNSAVQLEHDTFAIRRFSGERELFCGKADQQILEMVGTWKRQSEYSKGRIGNMGWVDPFEIYDLPSGVLDAADAGAS